MWLWLICMHFFADTRIRQDSVSLIKYRHQIEITMTAKNVPAEMLLGAVYGMNICAIPQPCSNVVDPIVSFVCKTFSKCDLVGATDNINVLPLFACDAENKPKMNEQIKNKRSIDDGHLISVSLVYELCSMNTLFILWLFRVQRQNEIYSLLHLRQNGVTTHSHSKASYLVTWFAFQTRGEWILIFVYVCFSFASHPFTVIVCTLYVNYKK